MRFLHVSDLHFGRHSIAAQVEALEAFIAREPLDAIAISGDLSQRTRRHEFEKAAAFVRRCESRAPTIVVPGNHDCEWWTEFTTFNRNAMFGRYREHIRADLEPHARVDGATIVGINSSHGIRSFTLTTRFRDLSVVGAVRGRQWERARVAFAMAPVADLKVLVVHHNLLRGKTSGRWGLASRAFGIVDAAHTGADLVCCGHDHEERIEEVEVARRRMIVCTAGTLTDRNRGDRSSSWNLIEADAKAVGIDLYEWQPSGDFRRTRQTAFARRQA